MNTDSRYLVVGMGRTGVDTVLYLYSQGMSFRAVDSKTTGELSSDARGLSKKYGIVIETGDHRRETFEWADTLIISPGVNFRMPLLQRAVEAGKEVISETEFASRLITKPVIAVTGSNGKTTTSSVIARVLFKNGFRVFLCGNIGTPLINAVRVQEDYDYIVAELSSFQLQGTVHFRPYISILLNISSNHLDHHSDIDEYVQSKLRICGNQTRNEWTIYNKDDLILREAVASVNSRIITFGSDNKCDIFFSGNKVITKTATYNLEERKLPGDHNLFNAMAAIAVGEILNCNSNTTEKAINEFKPLPHRIELVRTHRGVRFYNDSKSTTPAATLQALKSIEKPVVLILGGRDKGLDHSILRELIVQKVKHLVLIGESRHIIKNKIGCTTRVTLADTFQAGIETAFSLSHEGDSILLSPACSSFDMFRSYEERGEKFKEIVELL